MAYSGDITFHNNRNFMCRPMVQDSGVFPWHLHMCRIDVISPAKEGRMPLHGCRSDRLDTDLSYLALVPTSPKSGAWLYLSYWPADGVCGNHSSLQVAPDLCQLWLLVGQVGIEPTMFLMSLFYRQLSSPTGYTGPYCPVRWG